LEEVQKVAVMAALNRPTNATYTIHESVTVDTTGELFVLGMFLFRQASEYHPCILFSTAPWNAM